MAWPPGENKLTKFPPNLPYHMHITLYSREDEHGTTCVEKDSINLTIL